MDYAVCSNVLKHAGQQHMQDEIAEREVERLIIGKYRQTDEDAIVALLAPFADPTYPLHVIALHVPILTAPVVAAISRILEHNQNVRRIEVVPYDGNLHWSTDWIYAAVRHVPGWESATRCK